VPHRDRCRATSCEAVDRVVSDLENPFSSKNQSMREIAEDKNKQSRILLLGVCRSAREMLLSLQKSVPNSSMPALWQTKLDAARKEFLAFAEQIGIPTADAKAELARELGETVEGMDMAPATPDEARGE
jgi:hypothetical protein